MAKEAIQNNMNNWRAGDFDRWRGASEAHTRSRL
jgi:hypothetical protein